MRWYFRRLVLSGPAWLLLATISLGQMYLSLQARGETPPFIPPFPALVADYGYWWLVTPCIVYLVYRFRFDAGQWRRAVLAHLIAALVFALFPELVRVTMIFVMRSAHDVFSKAPAAASLWQAYRVQLGGRYGFEVTTYVAICAVVATIDLLQRSRDRDVHAARLEAELVQSRLRALSAQLHPHFLFNALNSIAMLIRDEQHGSALRTLVAYGELLRGAMDAAPEVPLRQEIAFMQRYLDIEQVRFPDQLAVVTDVAPHLGDALVPSLVLQPIVENALHHAFSQLDVTPRLTVSATRQNSMLLLEVTDNGTGLPEGWSLGSSSGLGLRNTRLRLAESYGAAQRLELHSVTGGGTRVVLELPYHIVSTPMADA